MLVRSRSDRIRRVWAMTTASLASVLCSLGHPGGDAAGDVADVCAFTQQHGEDCPVVGATTGFLTTRSSEHGSEAPLRHRRACG
jgi:hypothetical protein